MIRLSFAYRSTYYFFLRTGLLLLAIMITAPAVTAQSCASGADLDVPSKNAVEAAARQYLDMSKRGDVAGLKANSISAVAGDFGSIEQAVVTNKPYFSQGPATVSGTYLLDAAQAKGPLARADFYCGIYNSPERLVFSISNLPAGRYALVMQKIAGKDPITLTVVLQDLNGSWKLAGYYPRLDAIGGQDGQWYLTKAREFKSKGQLHNAWFYYLTAWDLLAPVNFMSTPQLDKVAEEMQSARPSDLPGNGNPLNLAANGKTFKVTEMVAVPVEDNLDLRLRYETADVSNTGLAFQDNLAVIKAIVTKYSEVRDAFSAVIALAVDARGHEYGSVLPMKDVK
ncbi:MAG TPA: hypothetical protein VFC29_19545 [Candidatus Limnocylindrales bacterium]|nr:hypothetical protein [Candidatus Limnocylindrales bacterium]